MRLVGSLDGDGLIVNNILLELIKANYAVPKSRVFFCDFIFYFYLDGLLIKQFVF
jgi:hypothetical protein